MSRARPRRLVAVLLAVVAGAVTALAAGAMFEPFALVGFWGAVNGVAVGLLVLLVGLGRGTGGVAVVGRWMLAAALAVVCWWAVFFAFAYGTPVLTLEGAWLWPVALASVVVLVLTVRWAWATTRRTTSP